MLYLSTYVLVDGAQDTTSSSSIHIVQRAHATPLGRDFSLVVVETWKQTEGKISVRAHRKYLHIFRRKPLERPPDCHGRPSFMLLDHQFVRNNRHWIRLGCDSRRIFRLNRNSFFIST